MKRAVIVSFCAWVGMAFFALLLYLKSGADLPCETQVFARAICAVLCIISIAVILLMATTRAEIVHGIAVIREKIPEARTMISWDLVMYTFMHTLIICFFAWVLSGYLVEF